MTASAVDVDVDFDVRSRYENCVLMNNRLLVFGGSHYSSHLCNSMTSSAT